MSETHAFAAGRQPNERNRRPRSTPIQDYGEPWDICYRYKTTTIEAQANKFGKHGTIIDLGLRPWMYIFANRAISCVNALAGMHPEKLREFIEAAKSLNAAISETGENTQAHFSEEVGRFDRALAALKGGK